jgi:hypothetical protein
MCMCAAWVFVFFMFFLVYRVITAMRPLHNGLFRLFKRYTVDPCAVGVAKDSVVAELHKCVLRWHDKRALCFARACPPVGAEVLCCSSTAPPPLSPPNIGCFANTPLPVLHSLPPKTHYFLSCVLILFFLYIGLIP